MSLDLAHDLRRFVDGGATPITLDEVEQRPAERGRRPTARAALVAAVVVLVLALVVAVFAADPFDAGPVTPADRTKIPLVDIPEGVSVQRIGNRDVFAVRDGSRVTVFDTNVQHLRGERDLWWCPAEQVFVAPTHAETFDAAGRAIGGPAQRSLDRYRASIRDRALIVDTSHRIPGVRGNTHQRDLGSGIIAWDTGPQSFCSGALRANSAASLVITAGPGLQFDQKVYVVPAGRVVINLVGSPGLTFTFDDPRFRRCLLGTDVAARHSCQVDLKPGTYLVYDTVTSHRKAGLEATIVAVGAR